MNEFETKLAQGEYRHIILFTGAGVSTNCGIPDYRSENGIFQQLHDVFDFVKDPADLFSRAVRNAHPEIEEHPIYQGFRASMLAAQPSASHHFAKWLDDQGWLKRVYTQNIDGLYTKAGLADDKLVEYHGNYEKRQVVMYGDAIPASVTAQVVQDLVHTNEANDCIIVMGTSLQVMPFCALPNMVPKTCMRILVDREPQNAYYNSANRAHPEFSRWASPTIKIGGREVSVASSWNCNELRESYKCKWRHNQHVYAEDCDRWSQKIMGLVGSASSEDDPDNSEDSGPDSHDFEHGDS